MRLLITITLTLLPLMASAAEPKPKRTLVVPGSDVSLQNEVQHAIDRGLAWLEKNQHANGYWSTADHPAVTALALMAFQGHPEGKYRKGSPQFLKKGYEFVLSHRQADGGIYVKDLPNYNTALSMMALVAANDPKHEATLRAARKYLVGLQWDFDEKGKTDNPLDGGIGYGSRYPHSDMSNTLLALEALYYTKHLAKDAPDAGDLNWAAAIQFIQNCQNLPAYNKQPWASDDAKNKGGFVYHPTHSMAGGETNAATGRVSLRSYGSISYAGMLSYIYADLKRDDPRVSAVFDWLRGNYTLEENPGMGPQGLFYYYHTMTKALTIYGATELELKDGKRVNWRKELAQRLLNLQARDGSWANENNRWWEKDPALVTAYAVLALEMIHRGL
ncbi:MAG: prenyltransferase/squalene oxidase repeat-containing protein [Verrucomicrobiota bacterium]